MSPTPAPMRDEEPLPNEAVVVRGGVMSRTSIEAAAHANKEEHGVYAVSVFSRAGSTAAQIWLETPEIAPPRYKKVRVSTVSRILAEGFQLAPTWESPHFDIVLPDPPDEATWLALDRAFDAPTSTPE